MTKEKKPALLPLLREQIKKDEGLMLFPYRDSQGILTLGYGRNLESTGITAEEAELLLDNDLKAKRRAVIAHIPRASALDEARLAVLINMAYNLGIGGLLRFHKMLAAVDREDWEAAAKEMLDSEWATQVGDRAKRLAQQMWTGVWV